MLSVDSALHTDVNNSSNQRWDYQACLQTCIQKCIFGFRSCQQFKVSLLILYSDARKRKKKPGCLINKTAGPQYSLWCLPPGISMSQLPGLMVCRYLDSDGYISLGSLSLRCTTTSLFLFSGVGRTFCPVWQSCQTCQCKSLIFLAHHAKHTLLFIWDVWT